MAGGPRGALRSHHVNKLMILTKSLNAAGLLALCSAPALAATTDYSFAGSYNSLYAGTYVSLGYVGTFTIADPTPTATRPSSAPDVTHPAYRDIWAGDSSFYVGAGRLSITFANGAQVTADVLDTVVNNTTFSTGGAPYPLGQSAQLYTRGAAAIGMTAHKVCPDGSIDDACDSSGDDPLYRQGDASDRAVQHMTGVYFAFYGAPLSTVAAGVPDLATTFGASNGGLGIYSVNELGQHVTTLTQFRELSSVTYASPVPEPAAWMLCLSGLAGLAVRRRRA